MKKDFQSLALNFATGWIRFWFPWVRLLEQDSVGDDTFHITDHAEDMELKTKLKARRKHLLMMSSHTDLLDDEESPKGD